MIGMMNQRILKAGRNRIFHFQPFSKKQRKILTWWIPQCPASDKDGIIADGAIRSGKTLSMSLSFVMWAMELYDGQTFAMCGKTIGSFKRNVLLTLKLMLITRGYSLQEHRADNYIEIRMMDKLNYFYFFGGRDESSQDLIQGLTLAGVLFDEVALMPESFVNQAIARCSVEGSKYWFNCNPQGPLHWFKVNWIDRTRQEYTGDDYTIKNLLYLHFTMEDNLSLSEKIKTRYRNSFSGVFYKRYILGLWEIADGVIYDMFLDDENTYSEIPSGIKTSARRYIAVDYGTTNPMVYLDCYDDGDVIWIQNEYYFDSKKNQMQKTDNKYGDDFDQFVSLDIQRPYKVIVDPSANSFEAELKNRGYRVKEADNAVLTGIRKTSTMIDKRKIRVNRQCKNWITEVKGYVWDSKAAEIGVERPIKKGDHAMDATRYLINTIITDRRLAR